MFPYFFTRVKFSADQLIGFCFGIYFLLILTAEKGLSDEKLARLSLEFSDQFVCVGT